MLKFYDRFKGWIGPILTILTIVVLFGIVFLEMGLAERSSRFYIELAAVSILAIQTRFYWYESTEQAVIDSAEIVDAKGAYDERVEKEKININELDECLSDMDEENYKNSIKNTVGHYTAINLGEKKYKRLLRKAEKKAHKIAKLKSTDVLTRGEGKVLYDAKNYQSTEKVIYQTLSGVLSILLVVVITAIAFDQIMLSLANLFRYLMYVWSIIVSMIMTVLYARRKTKHAILSHLSRLQFIVDKFCLWREGKREVLVCNSSEEKQTMPNS